MTGPSLKARAYQYLSRREMTRAELARKLSPHADSAEALEALLDELERLRHLSDGRFAEAWVNSKASQHGAQRLRHDLAARGVDADTIRETLASLGDSEVGRAREVWRKRFGSLPATPQEKAKQIRFLAGRGFSLTVIQRALKDIDLDDYPQD